MKNIILFYFNVFIFLSNFPLQAGIGSSKMSREEEIEYKIAKTLSPSYQDDTLSPVYQEGRTLKTKSQKPIKKKTNQSLLTVDIQSNPKVKRSNNEKVLGKDGRVQVLKTDEWPSSVHGLLELDFGSATCTGSGTLIASNLVLTAAHNLYDHDYGWGEVKTVYFCPALNGDKAVFGKHKVSRFYYPDPYKQDKKSSEDYGLLVLDTPVGEETGYFGLGILPSSHVEKLTVNVTGYPGNKVIGKKGIHEMWGMGGKPTQVTEKHIEYQIDTFNGQSGSGVWFQEGEDYYVVGVHVAGGDEIRKVNWATLLTKSRYDQINTWVQESVRARLSKILKGQVLDGITEIDLSSQSIGDFGVMELASYRLPALKTLRLMDNNIGAKSGEFLASFITLTSLDLMGNGGSPFILKYDGFGDEGALHLSSLFNLTDLNLSLCNVGDKGVKKVATLINLKRLRLGGGKLDVVGPVDPLMYSSLTAQGIKDIALLINLTSLDLSSNRLGSNETEALTSLTNLTELILSWNNTGNKGVKPLALLTRMVKLDLGSTGLGDEGIGYLQPLSKLQEIHVSNNRIGDNGLRVLKNFKVLRLLSIRDNSIGKEGYQFLLEWQRLNSQAQIFFN